jgi:threonyl-tRNA synthetase
LWLSPEQIRFVPVADRHVPHCESLAERAREAGLRPVVDDAKESVGKKIRNAQLMKAPYTVVVGDRDIEAGTYTVRDRTGTETGGVDLDALLEGLTREARSRSVEPIALGG